GDPAMKPGTSKMLTIDMAEGHYAIVCNLNGHYGSGMHQDFWVTPKGSTPITASLSDTDPTHRKSERLKPSDAEGPYGVFRMNADTVDHARVVLKSEMAAVPLTLTGITVA